MLIKNKDYDDVSKVMIVSTRGKCCDHNND